MTVGFVREIEVPVDTSEVFEALAVLAFWSDREERLPHHLRRQIAVVEAMPDAEKVETHEEGGGIVIRPAASILTLVANLRAQEP